MPRRMNAVKQVATDDVQGEDSWVKFAPINVDQWQRIQKVVRDQNAAKTTSNDAEVERLENEMLAIIAEIVLEWNWVDENDQPLPQLHNNVDVFRLLTMDEYNFILNNYTAAVVKKNETS